MERYTPAPPPPAEACRSCACMRPECLAPYGDGALPMCWLCAHLVTEHDHVPGMPVYDCGCKREQIYPEDVLASRQTHDLVYTHTSESGHEIAIHAEYAGVLPIPEGTHAVRVKQVRTSYYAEAQRADRRDRVARVVANTPRFSVVVK